MAEFFSKGLTEIPNLKPVSMLRFLSKGLAVETSAVAIEEDWFVLLWINCSGEAGERGDEMLIGAKERCVVKLRPRSKSRDESNSSILDLLKTKPRGASEVSASGPANPSSLDPVQIQPGTYDSATKRLVIGSRRLGKRKCCKASTPCIGTIPIQAEFQQRFDLPSFIHVSICYAEFEEQLEIAASSDATQK